MSSVNSQRCDDGRTVTIFIPSLIFRSFSSTRFRTRREKGHMKDIIKNNPATLPYYIGVTTENKINNAIHYCLVIALMD